MRKEKITIDLYNKPIGEAIEDALRDFEAFFDWIERKTEIFIERLAEEIRSNADIGFASALVDGYKTADVQVTIEKRGRNSVVVARGEDAIWVEFGAGIYHNGAVGTSPHPLGAELGFLIGTYGFGYGARRAWGFYEDGELVITRGTPAQMPLYEAIKAASQQVVKIANEVFV